MLALVSSSLALAAPLLPQADPLADPREEHKSLNDNADMTQWGGWWSVPKDAPTHPSTQSRFIVIGRPHSGAGWLKDMLNVHPNISCYGELLSERTASDLSKWYRQVAFGDENMLRKDSLDDAKQFRTKKHAQVEGFKWYHSQGDIDLFEPYWAVNHTNVSRAQAYSRAEGFAKFLKEYNFKVIIVDREDRVTRYVSEQQQGAKGGFKLDVDEMANQLHLDRQYGDQTKHWLDQRGVDTLKVTYQELVDHTKDRVRWAFQFLGADPNTANYTELYEEGDRYEGVKVSSESDREHPVKLRDIVWNYDEMVKKLTAEAPAFLGELTVDRLLHSKSVQTYEAKENAGSSENASSWEHATEGGGNNGAL
tara:strand:+ start:3562 stop:4656 length:1095 start_codon:yes stop_codon:yes gene_type:complete